MLAEQLDHVVGEPARVTELERVPKPGGSASSAAASRSSSRLKVGGSCQSNGPSLRGAMSGSIRSSSSGEVPADVGAAA